MSQRTVAASLELAVDAILDKASPTPPLILEFWDASRLDRLDGEPSGPVLRITSPAALTHVLREPNQLGLGRAWVSGALDCDDLDGAFEALQPLGTLRLGRLDRLRVARAAWRALGSRAWSRPAAVDGETRLGGRRHSRRRDRDAIGHHYDVPTDFYDIVLGPSLVYSCAYFTGPDASLEEAQREKLDRICRKLQLRAGDRLLDIGCGWGSLVIHAARHYGVHAVGVTVSAEQARVAEERVALAGLSDRCEIRLQDYRDVADGPYDAIASVGMYEHVGRAQLGAYASTIARLLRPGGAVLNHGIVREQDVRLSRKRFIDRFVFPDGELHPVGALIEQLRSSGLEVRDVESMREHYALTLRAWLANLARRREEAAAIAGPERERIWRLYMTGSARAFKTGEISVLQTLAVRPGAPHRIPLDRRRLLDGGIEQDVGEQHAFVGRPLWPRPSPLGLEAPPRRGG